MSVGLAATSNMLAIVGALESKHAAGRPCPGGRICVAAGERCPRGPEEWQVRSAPEATHRSQ